MQWGVVDLACKLFQLLFLDFLQDQEGNNQKVEREIWNNLNRAFLKLNGIQRVLKCLIHYLDVDILCSFFLLT